MCEWYIHKHTIGEVQMRGWVLWTLRGAAYLVCLCVGYVTAVAQGGEAALLSSRIGNTIDVKEREYFLLFPLIQGFIRGEVRWHDAGTILRVDHERDGVADSTVFVLDADETRMLGGLIDRFELLGKY